ncbi:unnamed protein product, partial [Laminaria digitata]
RFEELLAVERRAWRRTWLQAALVAVVAIICFWQTEMLNLARLGDGIPAIGVLMGEMFPPNFAAADTWIVPVIDTLAMSIAGTVLAILLSIPLAFLAAENTTPHPVVYRIARTILNTLRAIPELIMGIVFVAAVGFGALPGVLALGLHSVGMVGKFFAESIEHAHSAPIEAARAAGASPIQVVTHGVLPQVVPQFMDVAMYRWEYNFRASTVMGMVGAGGIGLELMSSLRMMQHNEAFAILLVILTLLTVYD